MYWAMLWTGMILAMFLFFLVMLFPQQSVILEWFILDLLGTKFSALLIFDFYSLVFSLTVIFISSMIFFFSKYYMDQDIFPLGFSLLLLSFVLSMLILIFSPNLVMLLLGWDGLGLTSYLLVVYYSSHFSSVAGMVTFLTNRLGDVFFLSAFSFFFFFFNWDYYVGSFGFFSLSFLLMVAFITKSAQVPFSSWLPAAMAAPTPVSSLVHSSTLVTAGVFLLIRFNKLVFTCSYLLLFLSVMTLLLAGLMAILDWDMKKIIAFSTLSQLGFMVSGFCMGMVLFSFFHLVTHALFKASLFMSAGVIIHSNDNSQEFRNVSNMLINNPLVSSGVVVCLLCLCGFPFTSGFFSKDLILDGSFQGSFLFFFFFLSVMMTISYSFRFSWYLFSSYLFSRLKIFYLYDNVKWLVFPIWLLISAATMGGFFFFFLVISFKTFVLSSGGWKMMFFFFFVGFILLTKGFLSYFSIVSMYFFSSMWFLNKMVSSRLTYVPLKLAFTFFSMVDQGVMERAGPQGIFSSLYYFSFFFFQQQTYSFVVIWFFFLSFLFFVM